MTRYPNFHPRSKRVQERGWQPRGRGETDTGSCGYVHGAGSHLCSLALPCTGGGVLNDSSTADCVPQESLSPADRAAIG